MTVPSPRPSNDDRVRAALWFAERGFGIFPVWSTRDGQCRCPAGPACSSPGKHPITTDGFKSATTDEQRIRQRMQGRTMMDHALELVRLGKTSVAEAMRIASDIDVTG